MLELRAPSNWRVFTTVGAISKTQSFYNKPVLDLDEQVRLLVQRGLRSDHNELKAVLKAMNLYRLSSYLWWFYDEDDEG